MERWYIHGPTRLRGTVDIHGAKNSVLPILSATILGKRESRLTNCPGLSDVEAAEAILTHLGCGVVRDGHTLTVNPDSMSRHDIPDHRMREMRSSIIFLGALLARCGEAHLYYPGGCDLGPRPVDLHLSALSQMGVDITSCGGQLHATAPGGLHGAEITLPFPSVGATENVLLAAVTAQGITVLHNAAREPEIVDLCDYLSACGAHITGAGESCLRIEGVSELTGCEHAILPDRIEAATYLAAAAATGGEITLTGVRPEHMQSVLSVLETAGCRVEASERTLFLCAPERLRAFQPIRTMPYPGFPTDAQALLMAAACTADGVSLFVETMFSDRYRHVGELLRMGADIRTEGRMAIVQGRPRLSGAPVVCTDLRGGAAMVIAALGAEGVTEIGCIRHIRRGYEQLAQTLNSLGAAIHIVEKQENQTEHTA